MGRKRLLQINSLTYFHTASMTSIPIGTSLFVQVQSTTQFHLFGYLVLHDLYICLSGCCPGNYGNRRLCDRMFESTRTKFPAPILRHSELQNLANYAVNSDDTDSNTIGLASFGNITNQPRVSFYH